MYVEAKQLFCNMCHAHNLQLCTCQQHAPTLGQLKWLLSNPLVQSGKGIQGHTVNRCISVNVVRYSCTHSKPLSLPPSPFHLPYTLYIHTIQHCTLILKLFIHTYSPLHTQFLLYMIRLTDQFWCCLHPDHRREFPLQWGSPQERSWW